MFHTHCYSLTFVKKMLSFELLAEIHAQLIIQCELTCCMLVQVKIAPVLEKLCLEFSDVYIGMMPVWILGSLVFQLWCLLVRLMTPDD
jgi:hypothetical protein